jgi:hypothetical protein
MQIWNLKLPSDNLKTRENIIKKESSHWPYNPDICYMDVLQDSLASTS